MQVEGRACTHARIVYIYMYINIKKNGTRSGKKKIVPDKLRMLIGFSGDDFSRRASYRRIMILEPAGEDAHDGVILRVVGSLDEFYIYIWNTGAYFLRGASSLGYG